MINVGIVGYGNLGKAVEKEINQNQRFNLVGIFSHRNINKENAFKYEDYKNFINKIDIMIMCGGSDKDLPTESPEICKFFNIIDTFDTHSCIKKYYKKINKLCIENNKSAILCCGWDPGFFSIMRVLYSSILGHSECFYGKGISLGHTNALKRINGIKNAKQYTIKNKRAVKQAKQGKPIKTFKHFRHCYVATDQNKKIIKERILNVPFYFKNEHVKIKFVSEKTLNKRHSFLAHKGEIHSVFKDHQDKICSSLYLKTNSNPLLTAKIITAYLNALYKMIENKDYRALTTIQIPVSYLINKPDEEIIDEFC